ncbi:hypothetical protein HK405_015432, partial [Cladochytrium tenue]
GTYFVAAVRDEELHLTPLTGTVQLRPALRYLDKIHEKQRAASQRIQQEEALAEAAAAAASAPAGSAAAAGGAAAGAEGDPRLLLMQARQADDKDGERRAAAAKERLMYAREEWEPLAFASEKSDEADEEFDKLFSVGDAINFVTTRREYLDEIGPRQMDMDMKKIRLKIGTPLDSLRHLPLTYQVKSILINANIVQFHTVAELVGPKYSHEEVLAELEKDAVLVR